MMTARKDLRPVEKLLVMDILKSLGMDVSKWADMKGGASRAASNPKYCYNWSFHQPGEFVVACFWYEGLKQKGPRLYYEIDRSLRGPRRTEPGTGSDDKRANELDRYLWLAYSEQLPLRVIFVDGSPRDTAKRKAASVHARLLDDVPWAVADYDIVTGECVMERGVAPIPITINVGDAEGAGFEGALRRKFIIHRRREGAMRRAKIAEAISRHRKLVCEVPKCGFDFEKQYGKLGHGYAQVHHLIPLHKAPPAGRAVKLSDLAIVCANCHVMIHAGGQCRPLAGLIK